MTVDIRIDVPLAQTRVRELINACDSIRGYEFVYSDIALLGLACTRTFDRAAHAFAWTTVQVVTGATAELIDDCEGIKATVEAFGEFDADIGARLDVVRSEFEFAGQ